MPHTYPDRDRPFRETFLLLRGPGYYDAPEGKNPWEKLWGINKYAIVSGLAATTVDCCMVSVTQNIAEVVNVLGYYLVPAVGLATAFASVTYIATNVRGKDDKINYALGVLGCMPVLHAMKKKQSFTLQATFVLMIAAILKKHSMENNFNFLGVRVAPWVGNYSYDYSLVGNVTEWPKRPY